MDGFAFIPQGNGVAISASTSSNSIAMAKQCSAIVVTNRSTSNAWVTWSKTAAPTAAFPTPGDTTGTFGIEVVAGSQVSIAVNGANAFVAVVLLTGTGVISIVPGDGV